ncbi:tail fiber domain-containing protein [Enterocloster lavalensis]|uniref:tail fiber domain-containing protein n=1 Tax=Enterocloster lavalensis TaxID=460384 RepID=UPI0034A459C3
MMVIPQEIKDLFRRDNVTAETARHIRLRFFDEDVKLLYPEDTLYPSDDLFPMDQEPCYVIENDQISYESLCLTESLCDDEDLILGACDASELVVIVADVHQDLTGKEFIATLEIGGYEMSLGIYRVDSFERQADRRLKKIIAYSRMTRFRKDSASWYQGLKFPLTLRQFRDSMCEYIGVKQIETTLPLDNMMITKTIDPKQLNAWGVLQLICEINGCFAHVDKTGRLKYVFLGTAGLFPSEELFPDEQLYPRGMEDNENTEILNYYVQSATKYKDYVTKSIDRIQIRQEEGDVGIEYGPGTNCYVIQGNFLVYGKSSDELLQIASTIYENISGRTYRPCKIVGPALPWVEPGDGILCYTSDDVIETYCLKRTMRGIQAMRDTFEAKGKPQQVQRFGIQTQLIQLEGKSAVIKKSVEEVSVRVNDLKEFTEAQVKIMADEILAEVTRAQKEEEALAASIRIQAGQIAMKVSKGDVSSQLSIEPDEINLKTNRLSWESDYSTMTRDGKLTCQNIHAINGYFSGQLETDVFFAGDNAVQFGDFYVTADGSNILRSTDGSVSIQTAAGGPFGSYTTIYLKSKSGSTELSDHHLNTSLVEARNEMYIYNDWWGDYSVTRTCRELWDAVFNGSDENLKQNIKPMPGPVAKWIIQNTKVKQWLWRENKNHDMGMIAQELEKTLKGYGIDYKFVDVDPKKGTYYIDYKKFIPLLILAIQDIYSKLEK